MKIIAFGFSKGGVGKTTAAIQAALYAAECENRVLFVDMDGQEDSSKLLGKSAAYEGLTSDMLFEGEIDAALKKVTMMSEAGSDHKSIEYRTLAVTDWSCRNPELAEHLDFIPSDHGRMASINADINPRKVDRFKANIDVISSQYDYIILDLPPGLGMCQTAGLAAAHVGVIPVIADFDLCGADKIKQYMGLYTRMRKRYKRLQDPLVILNQIDVKSTYQKRFIEEAKVGFGSQLVSPRIDNTAAVSNAMHARRAVWYGASSGNDRAKGALYRKTLENLFNMVG